MREACSKRKYILREDEKEWGYSVTCDLLMWPIKKEIPTSFAQRTNRDLIRRFYSTKGQTLKEISEKKGKRQKKKKMEWLNQVKQKSKMVNDDCLELITFKWSIDSQR